MKHGQRWFLWEDQRRENMKNWYMIYPSSTQIRTRNNQKHYRKQWMLCIRWNLKHKIIMIKPTHKNRIKVEVVSKIDLMRQVLHKHRNMKKCYLYGLGTHNAKSSWDQKYNNEISLFWQYMKCAHSSPASSRKSWRTNSVKWCRCECVKYKSKHLE